MNEKEYKSNINVYKSCFLTNCKNNTKNAPNKVFIRAPNNEKKRKLWCDATGINNVHHQSYACEDHFKLEEDLENYYEWRWAGARKRLKTAVVPRLTSAKDSGVMIDVFSDVTKKINNNSAFNTAACSLFVDTGRQSSETTQGVQPLSYSGDSSIKNYLAIDTRDSISHPLNSSSDKLPIKSPETTKKVQSNQAPTETFFLTSSEDSIVNENIVPSFLSNSSGTTSNNFPLSTEKEKVNIPANTDECYILPDDLTTSPNDLSNSTEKVQSENFVPKSICSHCGGSGYQKNQFTNIVQRFTTADFTVQNIDPHASFNDTGTLTNVLTDVTKKVKSDLASNDHNSVQSLIDTAVHTTPNTSYETAYDGSSSVIGVNSTVEDFSFQSTLTTENKWTQTTFVSKVESDCQTEPQSTNVAIQTELKKEKKNKLIQSTPNTVSVGVTCDLLQSVNKMDPVNNLKNEGLNESIETTSSASNLNTSTSYAPSDVTAASNEVIALEIRVLKDRVFHNYTKLFIEDNPASFIGINKDCMFVLDVIQKASSMELRDIYLVLHKIKMDLPFDQLQYYYGVSESQASRIFRKGLRELSWYFRQLIVNPSKEQIFTNLPIPFRYRYSQVHHIIDCFEIEIEKPSDALLQSLTWSEYKKSNTVKYLIGVTPDGLIIFISKGVCGRTSDMALVTNSLYLHKIPCKVCVMADRGFKQLDAELHTKNCTLLRPPSVKENVKSTKDEVKLTKQIASLRIHVERTINRVRNFAVTDIHNRLDNHFLDLIDDTIYLVCGLVNLQTPIIKQI